MRGHNPWRFDSAEHWVAFMESHYGPALKAREKLTPEAAGRVAVIRGTQPISLAGLLERPGRSAAIA